MTDIQYSSRPYRSGDEDAINELYFRITSRVRTREQWAWQWQQAPAGSGDIWLIEAGHPDGRVELIGHHGIMPVRFTWGSEDLLFGKTENTMVLPEYRQKILYPRFERRFAKEYESRYHALFSTMGPTAAIRQRKAMGYLAEHHWVYLEQAHAPWGSLVRVAQHPRFHFLCTLMTLVLRPRSQQPLSEGAAILTSEEARNEAFLADYWNRARNNWGVAPCRSAKDLAWRYWDNPYSPRYAVVVHHPRMGDALVIIEHHALGVASIEDFSAERPDPDLLDYALHSAIDAVTKRLGVRLVTCQVSENALPEGCLSGLRGRFRPSLISNLRKTASLAEQSFIPRKLTARGIAAGVPDTGWNITMAVSEGRR